MLKAKAKAKAKARAKAKVKLTLWLRLCEVEVKPYTALLPIFSLLTSLSLSNPKVLVVSSWS